MIYINSKMQIRRVASEEWRVAGGGWWLTEMMFAHKLMFPGKQLWIGSKDAGLLVFVQVIKFPLLNDDLENRRTGGKW